ncbi:MAG: hypothetical protein QRY74_01645 [Chlamydia sp.]
MIAHFRRYQRAIYLVITVVIIISFSFFGTYSTLVKEPKVQDEVIASLSDGAKIHQSTCSRFIEFLSEGQLQNDGTRGNPLNGGFLDENIFNTPFGKELILAFEKELRDEFLEKLESEKRFQPYQHPSASFVSARQVWSYFAPKMESYFTDFQKLTDKSSLEEIYEAKKNLYLAEREIPAFYLKQILAYQQKQYSWIDADPALDSKNLNMLGHANLEAWFGKRFMRAVALSIMDTAVQAEKQGFSVTYDEARLHLYGNARKALLQFSPEKELNEIEIAQKTSDLINATLVRYGMDEHEAVSIMRKCLLFKETVSSIPSHIVPTPSPFKPFLEASFAQAEISTYALPEWLRGDTLREIIQAQIWMDIVSSKESQKIDPLQLPDQFCAPSEVLKKSPDLVQKRFLASICRVKKSDFFEKIRLKDIWNWISADQNWAAVTQKYPILLEERVNNPKERVQIYESIQGEAKRSLDLYIRTAISDVHPEWIQQELQNQTPDAELLVLRPARKPSVLDGVQDNIALLRLLEEAPIGTPDKFLEQYTQDSEHFYKIVLLDRSSDYEIVPLEVAHRDGTLNILLTTALQSYYERLKEKGEKSPLLQKENGEYRDFIEVENRLLEKLYNPYLDKLRAVVDEWKKLLPQYGDFAALSSTKERELSLLAQVRYLSFVEQCKKRVEEGEPEGLYIEKGAAIERSSAKFQRDIQPLTMAWRLEREKKSIIRKDFPAALFPEISALFGEKSGAVTAVYYDKEKRSPAFSLLREISLKPADGTIERSIFNTLKLIADSFLGEEAIVERSKRLVKEMKLNGVLRIENRSKEEAVPNSTV